MPFLVQDQNSLKTPRKAVMCSHFPNNRQRTPLASCLRLCLLPSPNSCERNLRRTMLPDMTLRSEEHTSELQSHSDLVCRLLLEKKNKKECDKTRRYINI